MYSFFQEYYQDCVPAHNCQERILEVRGSEDVVLFNIFTVGVQEIGTGINSGAIFQNDSNQSGFTTEVSVWLPLPGDDDFDIVYVGPEVYDEASVTCPTNCVLVFPTSSLPSPTTIDPGDYTTSLEYGYPGTTTIGDGIVITTFFTTTTTITLDIDPVTTDGMPYSNINITKGQESSTLTVLPSVDIPPIGIPLPDGEGGTTTRTLTLPPWPAVTKRPPSGPGWGDDPDTTDDPISGIFLTPYVTTATATGPTVTTISFPATVSPITVSCPPDPEIPFNTPKTTATIDCTAPTDVIVAFTCPATRVVTFLGPSAGDFTVDCTLSTTFPPPPIVTPSPTDDPTTTDPLPTWTTWPPGAIFPVEEEVEEPEPDPKGTKTTCKLWFFSICLIKGDIVIRGLRWILPPGVYPPVPPPPGIISLPTPWTVKPPLPPWSQITVGWDKMITYPTQKPTSCEADSASICSTTVFESATITGTITSTVTSISSECDTIYGCAVTDWDITTTTTATADNCPLPTANSKRHLPEKSELRPRQALPPPGCPANAIVYPRDSGNVGQIPTLLAEYQGDYFEAKSNEFQYTSFFRVPNLDVETMNSLQQSPDVEYAYYYEQWNANVGPIDLNERQVTGGFHHDAMNGFLANDTILHEKDAPAHKLDKRARFTSASRYNWDLSQDSLPKGKMWRGANSDSYDAAAKQFRFHYDGVAGEGQYVYALYEEGMWTDHVEFTNAQGTIEELPETENFGIDPEDVSRVHGSGVCAKIVGAQLGICKKCNLVFVPGSIRPDSNAWERVSEHVLLRALDTLEDIKKRGRQGKAVVNMSFGFKPHVMPSPFYKQFREILYKMETELQVVLVASAGNDAKDEAAIINYPARYTDPEDQYGHIPNLIVVRATTYRGHQAPFSQYAHWMTTFAPGELVWVPDDPDMGDEPFVKDQGTSFSAPQVAGLAAYMRSLPSPWKDQLTSPANMKKMVKLFHRRFTVTKVRQDVDISDPGLRKPIIWNGQVGENSCLSNYDTVNDWDTDNVCPDINKDLAAETGEGETVRDCDGGTGGNSARRALTPRQVDGGSCPHPWRRPGRSYYFPSPVPEPRHHLHAHLALLVVATSAQGVPPDYRDPKDPNAGNPVPTTMVEPPPTTTGPNNPEPTCDDKCKLDAGNPCNCNENGCDENSPGCCGNGSCPMCDCNENGCSSDSPACCANGTCQWSWTGGGGGDGTGKPPGESEPGSNGFIIIALMELMIANPTGPSTWVREWAVLSAPPDGQVDLCESTIIESKVTYGATGSNPGSRSPWGHLRRKGTHAAIMGRRMHLGR
ncbi:hypothetical protein AJ79_00051 [Helicocarpus griseus UAMH5409]|uniref:Peptidase S8/S53 domain-containing protein n=1 Tax=Helicocarpus griseus UAMH5409 TaxID=1447875 RepID=A0A2B7YEI0_9EURO|nr:hypothetical protein AJ79_00051 [Helicocarpus griseus UAMH5409]